MTGPIEQFLINLTHKNILLIVGDAGIKVVAEETIVANENLQ